MIRCWRVVLSAGVLLGAGCGDSTEVVFREVVVGFTSASGATSESARPTAITVNLSAALPHESTVQYWVRDTTTTGHDDCGTRDHRVASGVLRFAAGQTQAFFTFTPVDDQRPEIDEHLDLLLANPTGVRLGPRVQHRHTLLDDDRTALIDVKAYGARGDGVHDDTTALRTAFAAAAPAAVVVFPPGTYLSGQLDLQTGVSYSGRHAVLRRLPGQPDGVRSLVASYSGDQDSAPLLVEGLTVDGARAAQGPFANWQFRNGALFVLQGDATRAGRMRAVIEGVALQDGVDSGFHILQNTDVRLCAAAITNVWRDALALRGGNVRLLVNDLRASADVGTAGLIVELTQGHLGTSGDGRQEIALENVRLESGDFVGRLSPGSSFTARRFIMNEAPFTIDAPGATVRFRESVLRSAVGPADQVVVENPSDVLFEDTDFHISEKFRDGNRLVPLPNEPFVESDRELSIATVRYVGAGLNGSSSGGTTQRLAFSHCRFFASEDVEPGDLLHVIRTVGGAAGVQDGVQIIGGSLDPRFDGLFAPECSGCQFLP